MRPISLADIDILARVLMACPPEARDARIKEICDAANVADRYRKRLGQQHPQCGSGTLMSAAALYSAVPRQSGMDRNYLISLHMIVEYLLQKHLHHVA